MSDQIITKRVRFDVAVMLHVCVCGQGYPGGEEISKDQDDPTEMDCCGRWLYWSDATNKVDIIEVDMAERA